METLMKEQVKRIKQDINKENNDKNERLALRAKIIQNAKMESDRKCFMSNSSADAFRGAAHVQMMLAEDRASNILKELTEEALLKIIG